MNSSSLTQQQQKPRFSVAITTPGYQRLINNTLADPDRAKRFVAAITSAVAVNPALQDCDAGTILAGGLLGESLGLSPSPQLGQYYLIPFECKIKDANGKTVYLRDENGKILKDQRGKWLAQTEKKAQFVLGYKGYIQLAVKSNQFRRLNVIEIKEGEIQHFDPLNEDLDCILIEDFDKREAAPTVGYYAQLELMGGFRKSLYWSKKKMEAHADRYSPAFSMAVFHKLENGEIPQEDMWKYSSFWYKDFDAMAKKTMLRQIISKWGVTSPSFQTAYEGDNNVITIGKDNDFVALPPVTLGTPDPDGPDEADAPEEPEYLPTATVKDEPPKKPRKVDMDAL